MFAATNHKVTDWRLCSLRFQDVKRPTDRAPCENAQALTTPAFPCLALVRVRAMGGAASRMGTLLTGH